MAMAKKNHCAFRPPSITDSLCKQHQQQSLWHAEMVSSPDKDSSSNSESDVPPYAWLWQNEQLSDVTLHVVFAEPGQPVEDLKKCADAEDQSTEAPAAARSAEQGAEPTVTAAAPASGVKAANPPPAVTVSTKKYMLHSQVVSSNSAFLRASLTSAVGSAKRKRDGDDGVCRWQIHAGMEYISVSERWGMKTLWRQCCFSCTSSSCRMTHLAQCCSRS